MDRRKFLSTTAAVGALTVIPRSVMGRGYVAPSDKIRLVHIGCGTEGLNEVNELLRSPQIEIVGVADPNKESYDYIQWSETGLRDDLRKLIGEPDWKKGIKGIPGGRDVMKEVVETYYKKNRPNRKGAGVECYEDYRELLDKVKDVDAVKIMTPDHLHGYVAADCFKRGKHIIMHKPLGNKMLEAMKVVDLATQSKLSTHMMAYNAFGDGNMAQIKAWLDAGAIGELKEIHNWTNRPVWPQYPDIPTDTPPIPTGFNWDLWLGPAEMRSYHPHYTHCVFRGWYEFGAGSIADMGYYSLWSVFDALKLGSATAVSTRFSRVIGLHNQVPSAVVNSWSYPLASAYKFEIPYKDKPGKITLFWHDGGMKPQIPEGYKDDDLPIEGMMFLGTKGAVVSGFLRDSPELVGVANKQQYDSVVGYPMAEHPRSSLADGTERWLQAWIDGCKTGVKGPGSFEFAREVTETFNLGSVSLQSNGAKLIYDPQSRKITNNPDADKLLSRETRKGWEFV